MAKVRKDLRGRALWKGEEHKAQEEKREPIIIPHFGCHVFRHTFCENETNIKVIQEIMGHANISITMDIYFKAPEEKRETVYSFSGSG